jgi:enolase
MVFDVDRYVHTVTLVGNNYDNYIESQNWVVIVGTISGATFDYTEYISEAEVDKYGKEIKVGAYGRSVGVASYNQILSFRWIAVFTTKTDCSGPFDWSGSR